MIISNLLYIFYLSKTQIQSNSPSKNTFIILFWNFRPHWCVKTMKTDAKFRDLLFDKAVIGLALCQMNGKLIDVNEAYAELIGRSIEETLSLDYWKITPKKYDSEEALRLSELESSGKYGPYEKEYIHKNGHLVPVRLSGQIVEIDGEQCIWSSVENITDRKQAEKEIELLNKKLEMLSFQDGLTGIANRRKFDQCLEHEWNRAIRDKTPLSLIMIDIDFFKEYNDNYGHTKGDEALKKVAKALSTVAKRVTDLASRSGGEEFVLLLPETNQEQALEIAQKCLDIIKEQKILHATSSVEKTLTISAGVCSLIPSTETKPSALYGYADKLLYKAKHNGRNRFEHQLTE